MKHVYLDLYNQNFLIFIGGTRDEHESSLSEYFGTKIELNTTECEGLVDVYKNTVLIYLRSGEKTTFNLGTIAHEADHATSHVFKIRGIEADLDNDEPHAYLIDWIYRQILGAIDEHNAE